MEKESETRNYEVLSKRYPVVINGYWFSIDEIDNKPLRGCGGVDRYIQCFYNQIIYTFICQLQRFINNDGFYGILEGTADLFKAKDNVLYLTKRGDFDEKINRALEYSCLDMDANALIVKIVLSPNSLDKFYKESIITKFKEDVSRWDSVLSEYKQKRAYMNRLRYLINMMDDIESLHIDCLKELIDAQKDIYKKRLEGDFILPTDENYPALNKEGGCSDESHK